jgi:hypothetical protein
MCLGYPFGRRSACYEFEEGISSLIASMVERVRESEGDQPFPGANHAGEWYATGRKEGRGAAALLCQ